MKKILLALLSVGVIAQLLGDVDDQKIKRLIFGAWCYVDNMDAAERAFNSAWNMCGGDSNRFSRLLYEITLTNDVRHSACAMRLLSRYATPPQLPYLYSVSTNSVRGAEAVKGILRIEGITTNSVFAVSNCLAQTGIDVHDRYVVFCDFADRVYRLAPEDACRSFGLGYIRQHALRENSFCLVVDEELIKHDPTYRTSKRRLAVLRSVNALGVNEFQIGYITNAINELVAYPEANLPE